MQNSVERDLQELALRISSLLSWMFELFWHIRREIYVRDTCINSFLYNITTLNGRHIATVEKPGAGRSLRGVVRHSHQIDKSETPGLVLETVPKGNGVLALCLVEEFYVSNASKSSGRVPISGVTMFLDIGWLLWIQIFRLLFGHVQLEHRNAVCTGKWRALPHRKRTTQHVHEPWVDQDHY